MYSTTSLIVTAAVLPFLGIIAICLRFYVRLRLKPTFVGIDDWLITFSCILVCASGANQIVGATIGELGRDSSLAEPHRAFVQAKCNYAVLIGEKITYSSIKISVLFFYRRIFTTPTFRRINNILILLVAAWGLLFLFSEAFLCSSTSNDNLPCASSEWRALWFAITDVITDIIILSMPYPMIKGLQMGRREKIGLSGIFLLGALSVIAGILRLGFVTQTFSFYYKSSPSKGSAGDAPPFWTTFEISIGVLAACLPPLGPLIRRIPSPSKLYDSVKGRLGSRSSAARSTMEVPIPAHVSNAGWISLPDRKRPGDQSDDTTQGNRQSLEV